MFRERWPVIRMACDPQPLTADCILPAPYARQRLAQRVSAGYRKMSFDGEFLVLLKKHGLEFDSKLVLVRCRTFGALTTPRTVVMPSRAPLARQALTQPVSGSTNPVQNYVDLSHCGGRGEEAAGAILEQMLKPEWSQHKLL